MSDDDKVIFLAFNNPKLVEDVRDFLACSHCRNKTYTLIVDRGGGFPLVTCAACGTLIGRVGWSENGNSAA